MYGRSRGCKPGFINIRLKKSFVADYLNQMEETDNLGIEKTEHPEMIVLDYGGPNVAKPLHVDISVRQSSEKA